MVKSKWQQVVASMTLAVSFTVSSRCWYRLIKKKFCNLRTQRKNKCWNRKGSKNRWYASLKGSEDDRHPLICIYTIMNYFHFLLTSLWNSSNYQESLQLLFFPKAVPLQQICFLTLFFLQLPYKFSHPSWWLQGITKMRIRVISLSWRVQGPLSERRDGKSRNQSSLGLLNFFSDYLLRMNI